MRIVFMGTPDFAVPTLEMLIKSKHEVVGVFSQPDKPNGRGHQLKSPPVKLIALEHDIPVFQPSTLRTKESADMVSALAPDLIVVVAYGKILPVEILEIPPKGCINVHASLLPKYRGAAPIQWSVLNGEPTTGVTTMYMAQGLDTGDMLLKVQTPVGENETASQLHDRLKIIGAELLMSTLDKLEAGTLEPIPQDSSLASHAPQLTKEMSPADFNVTAYALHKKISGLSEWPCAVIQINGKPVKAYRSEIAPVFSSCVPGELISDKELIVACAYNTAIKLVEVQGQGAKRMRGSEFMRGQRLKIGSNLSDVT